MSELHRRKDVTPEWPGPFGGYRRLHRLDRPDPAPAGPLRAFGTRNVRCAPYGISGLAARLDRIAIFVGRVTMMMIISMTMVMLYEVFLRYVVEAPTLWANELTLWIAGFVFLSSGLYAMQQRCHIRIFLLYDVVPRWLQKHLRHDFGGADLVFAFFLIFGSYKQVFVIKFYKWEMFGTAFDPPIPATIQPMILIMVTLIATQALINLIADWNLEPDRCTRRRTTSTRMISKPSSAAVENK